jgi:SAM-dependent methyltransferase
LRLLKAKKIEVLLGVIDTATPLRLLEVGTGSGVIAHYFGTQEAQKYNVFAVDVLDQRQKHEGYSFQLVTDTCLPYADASFDIVISNHVIEHVGEKVDQIKHLMELKRVLANHGVGYLAVPSRWMLVESHYKLAFLSWLPRRWRSGYLRIMGYGDHYDCEPLQLSELDHLLELTGFRYQHVEIEAFRLLLKIEGANTFSSRIAQHVPDSVLALLRPIMPTLICRLFHE